MPRKPEEISILDMSILRSSISDAPSVHSGSGADLSSTQAGFGSSSNAQRKRRQKENDPEILLDLAKLKGRQRVTAMKVLDEVVQDVPSLSEQKELAIESYKKKLESVDRILELLHDDAKKLPLNILGDFTVLAINPKPFADTLEAAASDYALRSPDQAESRKMKESIQKKLKTSTSLVRVNPVTTPSTKNVVVVSKPVPKQKFTPLRNKGLKK